MSCRCREISMNVPRPLLLAAIACSLLLGPLLVAAAGVVLGLSIYEAFHTGLKQGWTTLRQAWPLFLVAGVVCAAGLLAHRKYRDCVSRETLRRE